MRRLIGFLLLLASVSYANAQTVLYKSGDTNHLGTVAPALDGCLNSAGNFVPLWSSSGVWQCQGSVPIIISEAVPLTVNQGTSPWIVAGGGAAGTAATGVVTVQGITAMTPLAISRDDTANGNTHGLYTNLLQGDAALSITNPGFMQIVPGTTGGLSNYVLEPVAGDNHAVIKNGATQIYAIQAFNNSATINYIRIYNLGTGFNGCGSATGLAWEGHIPASTSDAGFTMSMPNGLALGTGASLCVTGAYGQTDTTNATASAISLNIQYK